MLQILHSSDLHGNYKALLATTAAFDLWVDTGDFFPNRGRVPATGYQIVGPMERRHQARWLEYKALPGRLARWLDGRPALSVAGNHDFVSLTVALRAAGADAHEVTAAGLDRCGLRFSGFRHIPRLSGEWPGETDDFSALIAEALGAGPDVLVTHAPPAGVLDRGGADYGIPGLRDAIAGGQAPGLRAHLFGHDHACAGEDCTAAGGVRFYNGATRIRLLTLP